MGGSRVFLFVMLAFVAGAGTRAHGQENPDDAPPPKPGSKVFDVEEDLKQIDPEKGKESDQPQRVDEQPGDRRVVNLLALIDPATAPGLGTWKKNEAGELVSSDEPKAWIEAPFKVGGEYDFVIEFTRLQGNNDTAQIISFGGRKFAWVLGAKDGTRSVFSTIRGRSWGNKTDISTEGLIEPGKHHRCVVSCREGVVFVNGEQVDEPYLEEGVETSSFGPVEVPEGFIFVMGDNRTNSEDSRSIGPVDVDTVVGRAFILIWPPSDFGTL